MLEDLDPAETREWVDALDSVLAFEGAGPCVLPARRGDRGSAPQGRPGPVLRQHAVPEYDPARRKRGTRGIAPSSTASARSSAGTRWRSCCAPTRNPPSSAAISPASSPPPRCTTSASCISGTPRTTGMAATWCSCRAIPRRASTPARSWKAGCTEEQMMNFRQEVGGGGLSSYPHPWLMPDFWQFPDRVDGPRPDHGDLPGAVPEVSATAAWRTPPGRKVWAFLGDGETDEPESLGAIAMAGREKLDNLIFVINCNLQRLDGPVRGNGKIIQELEGIFRGAGWNVIKVIWGSGWDPLIARDSAGLLLQAHGGVRRRRVSGLQVQERRLCARAFLRQVPGAAGDGRRDVRRRDLGAEPRRPRSAQGLCRLRGGRDAQRPAHRHPGQDRQGLRHGRGRRGPEHHPPAEEDGRGRAGASSATVSACRSPTSSWPRSRSCASPTTAPRWPTCGSGAPRSAATCQPGAQPVEQSLAVPDRSAPSSGQLKGTDGPRRSPRPWPSCGS